MKSKYHDLLSSNEDIHEDITGEKTKARKEEEEESEDTKEETDSEETEDSSGDDTSEEETSEEETSEEETEEETSEENDLEEQKQEEENEDEKAEEETEEGEQESDADEDVSEEESDKTEEVDTHVKDETDISESFDHIDQSEREINNADHTVNALKEAGEELEEVKETLEAFREDASQFTPLARKMVDQKLRHCGYRLGCDYQVASTEGFKGDKYDDTAFVDSLESAIGDTLKNIAKVIKEWIRKALEMGRKMWKYATDITRRIHGRMKTVKERLKKTKPGDMDIAKYAQIAVERTRVADWAIAQGNTLAIKPNHVQALEQRLGKFKDMQTQDIKTSQGFIKDIGGNLELTKIGGGDSEYASVVERTAAEYMDSVVEAFGSGGAADILPGGHRLVLADHERKRVVTIKNKGLKEPSADELKSQLVAFASKGDNLSRLAEWVEKASAPSGVLSKDFERFTEKFYKDLQAAADKMVDGYRSDEDERSASLKRHPALSTMQMAVGLGFSASIAARKVWLKALHAASNALIVFAAGKSEKPAEEPAAA